MRAAKRKNNGNNLITWRFMLVCGAVLMVFVTLVARAAYLQVIEPDKARSGFTGCSLASLLTAPGQDLVGIGRFYL